MKRGVLFLAMLGVMGLTTSAKAKVFDITDEKIAGYFSVSGGSSSIGKNAFLNEDATTDTYDKSVGINETANFGFLYSSSNISFRFGFEAIVPQSLTTVTAKNSGGTAIYSLNSNITGYAPEVGMEFTIQKTPTMRSFLCGYAGSGSISYKNDYTIISYAGMSNHSVQAKGTAALYGGSLGIEAFLTDTTTYLFELGYRKLSVGNLVYSQDVTTFSGSHTAGNAVLDVSGNQRILDFSGPYISLGLRFYM